MPIARAVGIAAAVVLLGACRDISAPPRENHLAPGSSPKFSISDGAHHGNERLYFLPPLVPAPTFSGTFDPSAFGAGSGDVVEVCQVQTIFVCSTIVSFGPGDVTMDPTAETYQLTWHTKFANLDPLYGYRILVKIGGQTLGYADVKVVTSGADKQTVDPTQYIAVKVGTALPIQFRLQKGPVIVVPSGETISARGDGHGCALTGASAYCWGSNDFWGEMGDGVFSGPKLPALVIGGVSFTSISTGGLHTCALTASGQAYCWGRDQFGELGTNQGVPSPVERTATPTPVTGALSFNAITVGYSHSCALTSAGAAYCWGLNADGQLGDGTNTDENAPTPVAGNHAFKAISAGDYHTCAIDFINETYCWGRNDFGQVGGSPGNVNFPRAIAAGPFVSISAGGMHTCGLQNGGEAFCWGNNDSGELGNGVILKTSVATPVVSHDAQGNAISFVSISAGFSHTCGVAAGGAGYCWGADGSGALGDADYSFPPSDKPAPQLVAGGLTWAEISAGRLGTCGRTTTGAVYCWGVGGEFVPTVPQYNPARQPTLLTFP